MPSVEENIEKWNDGYDWRLRGDAWSRPWGGAESQWYGSIFLEFAVFYLPLPS